MRFLSLGFVLAMLVVVIGVSSVEATGKNQSSCYLQYGDSYSAYFDGNTIECYFYGYQGDTVVISMNSADFDTYLYLFDDNGTQLDSDDDSGLDYNAQIEYTLPYTGNFYIRPDAYNNSNRGSFTLSVTQSTGSTNVQTLRHNCAIYDSDFAGRIEVNRSERNSLYWQCGDRWTFSGRSGDTFTIELFSTDFDTYLELVSPNDILLEQDDDGAGDGNSRIANYQLQSTGTYTIIVKGYDQYNDVGTYTLRLSGRDEGGGDDDDDSTSNIAIFLIASIGGVVVVGGGGLALYQVMSKKNRRQSYQQTASEAEPPPPPCPVNTYYCRKIRRDGGNVDNQITHLGVVAYEPSSQQFKNSFNISGDIIHQLNQALYTYRWQRDTAQLHQSLQYTANLILQNIRDWQRGDPNPSMISISGNLMGSNVPFTFVLYQCQTYAYETRWQQTEEWEANVDESRTEWILTLPPDPNSHLPSLVQYLANFIMKI